MNSSQGSIEGLRRSPRVTPSLLSRYPSRVPCSSLCARFCQRSIFRFNCCLTSSATWTPAINSARFAPHAGAEFSLTFVARVSPQSIGSGYFDVVFLSATQELRRFQIPLQAAMVSLGQVVTDASGGFDFELEEAPADVTAVRAWYAGDDQRWPAYAELVVGDG